MLKLGVKNFQAIESLGIQVSGITVLKGPCSSGKSSFLKAIQSAAFNRFSNASIRWGTPSCKVILGDETGALSVEKTTGSIKEVLKIGDKLQVFSKLNRDTPSEVKEFLNFKDISFGSSQLSLNFHNQFEEPLFKRFSDKRIYELTSASKALDSFEKAQKEVKQKVAELSAQLQTFMDTQKNTEESLQICETFLKSIADTNFINDYEEVLRLKNKIKDLSLLLSLLKLKSTFDISDVKLNFKEFLRKEQYVASLKNVLSLLSLKERLMESVKDFELITLMFESFNLLEIRDKLSKGLCIYLCNFKTYVLWTMRKIREL